jgi:hypothetical protein
MNYKKADYQRSGEVWGGWSDEPSFGLGSPFQPGVEKCKVKSQNNISPLDQPPKGPAGETETNTLVLLFCQAICI